VQQLIGGQLNVTALKDFLLKFAFVKVPVTFSNYQLSFLRPKQTFQLWGIASKIVTTV
jgi:hypothetical protein